MSQENRRPQPTLGKGDRPAAGQKSGPWGQMRPGKPCSAPKTKVLCPGSPRQGRRGSHAPLLPLVWATTSRPAPDRGQPAGHSPPSQNSQARMRPGAHRRPSEPAHSGAVTAGGKRPSAPAGKERPTTLPPSQKRRRCAVSKALLPASLQAPALRARPRTHGRSRRAPTPAASGPRSPGSRSTPALRRRPLLRPHHPSR